MTDPTVIEKDERDALKLFKEKIRDVVPTLREYYRHDVSLLRWLRARELNITRSEGMLRKWIAWRAKNDIDSRLNWKVPDFLKTNYPYQISGFNKNGNIIICVTFGKWDVRKAVSAGFKLDLLSYVDQIFEVLMRFMETGSTKDSIKTQCVAILDFEGFTLRQLTSKETIECILEFVRRLEENYPEVLYAAWVVNDFRKSVLLLAQIGKPLLTPRTVAKLRICGSNSDQWRHSLLETIEPGQLPSSYGGSNTSCKNYKAVDGVDVFPVHETFPENEFIPVTVDAGMKQVLKYSLCKNSRLCWNFRTIDYDIGFSLVYHEADLAADTVIFECARADSHRHLQTGMFVADKPGTYSLVFDNSFSRFRKKSIFYFVQTSAYANTVTSTDASSIIL